MFTFSRKIAVIIGVIMLGAFARVDSVHCELPPLISREVLFGNPQRTAPEISPDGKSLAWLQPDNRGILQVWVETIGKHDARIVTADRHRGIRSYGWAWNSKTILTCRWPRSMRPRLSELRIRCESSGVAWRLS